MSPGPGRSPSTSNEEVCKEMLMHPSPALTAAMVADAVSMSRQGADSRLRDMEEDELVVSYKDAGTRLWWLTLDGRLAANNSTRAD